MTHHLAPTSSSTQPPAAKPRRHSGPVGFGPQGIGPSGWGVPPAAVVLFVGALVAACQGEAVDIAPEQVVEWNGALVDACAAAGVAPVLLWDVDNGHGAITAMDLDAAGNLALAGTDGVVKLWQIEERTNTWSASPTSVLSLSGAYGFEVETPVIGRALELRSADLIVGGEDGQVRRFGLDSGELLSTGAFSASGEATSLRDLALFGDQVLVGYAQAPTYPTHSVGLWNAQDATFAPVSSYIENSYFNGLDVVSSVATSKDGRFAATGGNYFGPSFELWVADAHGVLIPHDYYLYRDLPTGAVKDLAFAHTSDSLFSLVDVDVESGAGDAASGERLMRLAFTVRAPEQFFEDAIAETASVTTSGAKSLAVSSSDATVVLATSAGLELLDGTSLAQRASIAVPAVEHVALSDDGRYLVTGGSDGIVRVFGCALGEDDGNAL